MGSRDRCCCRSCRRRSVVVAAPFAPLHDTSLSLFCFYPSTRGSPSPPPLPLLENHNRYRLETSSFSAAVALNLHRRCEGEPSPLRTDAALPSADGSCRARRQEAPCSRPPSDVVPLDALLLFRGSAGRGSKGGTCAGRSYSPRSGRVFPRLRATLLDRRRSIASSFVFARPPTPSTNSFPSAFNTDLSKPPSPFHARLPLCRPNYRTPHVRARTFPRRRRRGVPLSWLSRRVDTEPAAVTLRCGFATRWFGCGGRRLAVSMAIERRLFEAPPVPLAASRLFCCAVLRSGRRPFARFFSRFFLFIACRSVTSLRSSFSLVLARQLGVACLACYAADRRGERESRVVCGGEQNIKYGSRMLRTYRRRGSTVVAVAGDSALWRRCSFVVGRFRRRRRSVGG